MHPHTTHSQQSLFLSNIALISLNVCHKIVVIVELLVMPEIEYIEHVR